MIRALPDPVRAPGVTASTAVLMATAAPPPTGIAPPHPNAKIAARAPPPPTTWAARRPCGSPPRARAAGTSPPATYRRHVRAFSAQRGPYKYAGHARHPAVEP